MNMSKIIAKKLFLSFLFFLVSFPLFAQDELLVKRESVFEFAKEPTITKKENQYIIEFETKSFCDVTIAIEVESGEIVRHLACGVLGKKAPPSFQPNSLKQSILWDGKNDRGEYVKEFNTISVRVSLGLSPLYEKNLYYEPKRRQGREAPIMQATPEGVYVYDGGKGMDFVKLYGHNGEYIKTIYPFPGDKIKDVKGLNQHTFPDGKTLPEKPTFLRQTFLTSGNDYGYGTRKKFKYDELPSAFGSAHYGMEANASSILAVGNGKIALGMKYLFRFATDGTSGGMEVEGPRVAIISPSNKKGEATAIIPRSACLSPDGKTLYLTAYHFCRYGKATFDIVLSGDWHTYHCVLKMDLTGDKDPELFVGNLELDKSGNDDKSFFVPANVTCDKAGRVYVSDYMNDRVQIFSPEGQLLKSLSVISPSQVSIHAKTQEVFVFSSTIYTDGRGSGKVRKTPAKSGLTIFDEFSKGEKKQEIKLPKEFSEYAPGDWYLGGMGFPLNAIVDTDGTETNIWLVREWARENVMNVKDGKDIASSNIKIYTLNKDTLVEKADFEKEVIKKNISTFPAADNRPRLYVNPKNQRLYIAEGRHNFLGKAFKEIKEVDPISGKTVKVDLPFDAEDMTFDQKGFAYLRTLSTVARYDISTNPWREVPWDYGIESNKVHTDSGSARKEGSVVSAIAIPGGGDWHHGGMHVNSKGQLAITCITPKGEGDGKQSDPGFKPVMYPGRSLGGRGGNVAIHVYDQFGKVLHADFVPGLANNTYGIGLDNSANVYLMSASTRMYNGVKYYRNESGTMMKFKPNKGKITAVGSGDIPITLPEANYLKDPYTLADPAYGHAWVEGADWFFGGVGFSGKNAGVGCSCWNARMAFDYFNRSFAPEIDRYSVAVLDEEGNLILRVGTYGNADSQGAKSKAPLGGDEVGMMHGAYLGTLTDKFLFIADPANQNVISVKLNYAKSHKQKLPQ